MPPIKKTGKSAPAAKSSKLSEKFKTNKQSAEPPHLVVRAYAGTGKTFTQIVGVAWAFGQGIWREVERTLAQRQNEKRAIEGKPLVDVESFRVVPSEEQKAVWDSFALSRGSVKTITYCAFNKSIVTEFGEAWGWLVKLLQTQGITLKFATVNGLGNSACYRAYGKLNPVEWHTGNLLAKHLGIVDTRELNRREPIVALAVNELVGLCKLTLAGWTEREGFSPDRITADVLDEIVSHHEIELNGSRERVYELVPIILEQSLDIAESKEIDFNDQNWLPIVQNLPITKVDLLLVDESQDLPRCKQEFARKAGRRLCVVGDIYQAIYGFAGADVDSIPRMERLLGVSSPLQLTETRRCCQAVVAEAQKIVRGFKAHPSNSLGVVREQTVAKYRAEVDDQDMVLCRTNAPLISQALKFIKDGRKAVIRGRDFGKSLVKFVEKMNAPSVPELVSKIETWLALETDKENAKRNPSEQRLIGFQDKHDCIMAFIDGAATVQDVITKLDLVFAGKECPKCHKHYSDDQDTCPSRSCEPGTICPVTGYPEKRKLVRPTGILFSSVHRAKGLESRKVFILLVEGAYMPHPMATSEWQIQQEWNCKYIAVTRAIEELVYVR